MALRSTTEFLQFTILEVPLGMREVLDQTNTAWQFALFLVWPFAVRWLST